ncbi:MAG: DUF4124 domain-containing protein [Candidatus Nitricoxidivorans perseverans]|uniref:DUF4124 domain-containing protein n=1 Tax=Candidatus Nitricoxidivorans perseverans TaxID=2975601 RepID=A0AA49IXP8_9PROT|nr:MAG: DUF4124 domain-containing protein [Candidatus Nitricoxidivorans perseverans]
MRPVVTLLSVFVLLPLAAAAQVYTWKDAGGRIHYSDQPPIEHGLDARKMGPMTSPPPEATAAARKQQAESEAEARKRRLQAKEAAGKSEKEKSALEERQKNCERARSALQGIESGQTRFRINDKGDREALDGEAREAELAGVRKSVADWCK